MVSAEMPIVAHAGPITRDTVAYAELIGTKLAAELQLHRARMRLLPGLELTDPSEIERIENRIEDLLLQFFRLLDSIDPIPPLSHPFRTEESTIFSIATVGTSVLVGASRAGHWGAQHLVGAIAGFLTLLGSQYRFERWVRGRVDAEEWSPAPQVSPTLSVARVWRLTGAQTELLSAFYAPIDGLGLPELRDVGMPPRFFGHDAWFFRLSRTLFRNLLCNDLLSVVRRKL